jgi:hypothetical protein
VNGYPDLAAEAFRPVLDATKHHPQGETAPPSLRASVGRRRASKKA